MAIETDDENKSSRSLPTAFELKIEHRTKVDLKGYLGALLESEKLSSCTL